MTGSASETPAEESAPGNPPGLPRWVKVLAAGALLVLVTAVLVALLVGGEHGPGMHGG